ncbi:MAG: putative bifunctional diguanylate cyclase/phosphodiesterase [Thermoleophilaceae bacterium]
MASTEAPTPLHVLLVEDNPADAALVEALIDQEVPGEFTFERTDRLATACERLALDGVDCVLYDLGLPDASGLDGLAKLREVSPAVAVVVLTGDSDVTTGIAALKAGAQDYLVKGKASGDAIARAMRHSVERRGSEERLQHMADHDPLTGLLNRRRLEEELERHASQVRRYGREGALLVLDIDHFKHVNDALGHRAGDELISSVATVLRERLRASDILARLGGDEFALLLPKAGAREAQKVAEDLLAAVRKHSVLVDGGDRRTVTASVGVALFEDEGGAAGDDVLVRADLAMYDAKEAGRDGLAFAADGVDARGPRRRLTWGKRIRGALSDDRFVLYAQPIMGVDNGDTTRYELLLRLDDQPDEVVLPGQFLHIAERLDLIQEIDRWVVTKALQTLAEQPAGAPRVTLEVNLSGRSVGDPVLMELIERGVEEHGVDPSRLVLEVTETAAVANFHRARTFANRLADLGCHFALDDFGAGFGSFYYLKHLPFDFLKIDGEFVRGCLDSRTDQLVIEAVVGIARGLGKETIAEFVEEPRTAAFLESQGVDYLQGYWIGRPEPATEVLQRVPAA